jgi:hypothetical protein
MSLHHAIESQVGGTAAAFVSQIEHWYRGEVEGRR